MKATEIEEYARQLWETSGAKAVAEAAQKVRIFEEKGDKEQVETRRRIEAALMQMKGPRES
jgi:vacuolar-type H+-ATPase subunit E/Vma4